MRIIIDIQSLQTGSKYRGIGNYSLALVQKVLELGKEHEILLLANFNSDEGSEYIIKEFDGAIDPKNIIFFHSLENTKEVIPGNLSNILISEKIRTHFIDSLNPDFVFITSLFEGAGDNFVCSIESSANYKVGVIGYDLIPLFDESKYLGSGAIKDWYYRKLTSLKNADYIFSISKSSKQEFIDYLSIPDEKLINISSACSELYCIDSKIDKCFLQDFHITREFVLYSGSADERKNLGGLFNAFAKLPKEVKSKYQIVLVGRYHDEGKVDLNKLANKLKFDSDTVVYTDFISNETLKSLYNQCSTFVFPSFHEGFGLPVLEAMTCGAPTICSNNSSLPEVIGLDDAMFDPKNIDDISSKLLKSLEDHNFKKLLTDNAIERVALFSWEQSVTTLLEFIEEKVEIRIGSFNYLSSYNIFIEDITKIIQDYAINQDTIKDIVSCVVANQKGHQQALVVKSKLFLDISSFIHFDHATGIQRVVRAICEVLLLKEMQDFDCEIVFSYPHDNNFYYADISKGKFSIPIESTINNKVVDFCEGDILVFLDLHFGYKTAVMSDLKERGIRSYFVVYDLLPIYHPQYFVQDIQDGFADWLDSVISSDGALCISKDVSDKLHEWVKKNNKVTSKDFTYSHFHLGANIEDSVPSTGIPTNADSVKTACSSVETFLMVGTIEPRKGHTIALDAIEALWRNGNNIALIIVGKAGWNNDILIDRLRNHKELNKRLFWLEGISDEYLDIVYKQASCLIASSEGEGFGLPLIEGCTTSITNHRSRYADIQRSSR
ncbi:glycosyltransferase [Psychromonas sp. KJ10-10]|uniref:glycosyltransferase n=1 Tax=Psychromonas sp. KJ10-10 TaxID=3391823 RepID=UPI0039B3C7FD